MPASRAPPSSRNLKRDELSKLIDFEHTYKSLVQSIKTYFEGEVLNFNRSRDTKKEYKSIEDFAPESLLRQMKEE